MLKEKYNISTKEELEERIKHTNEEIDPLLTKVKKDLDGLIDG